MALFRRNKSIETPEQSVCVKQQDWSAALCGNGKSFFQYLWGNAENQLSFNVLYGYYARCAPVADAIDRIAKEFASIEPRIYDCKQDEFVETNFLDVLYNPNISMTKHQFLHNLAANYLICGNTLLYGTGVSKLQELNYVEASYLTLYSDSFNTLDRIQVNKSAYSQEFKFQELNGYDFFTAPNQIARFIRTYSPYFNYSSQFGLSKLSAISFEIEQFLAASNHNLSLLGNTVAPSAILTSDFPLEEAQKDALKARLEDFYAGAANTGKALILPRGMQFNQLNTRVDSDFQVLRQNVEKSIYQRLEIPLALTINTAMTFNNLEVANLQLYDNAVLPLAKTLYKQLQDIIFYYGKIDHTRYCIAYDVNEIEALAVRKSQLIKDKAATNSYTMNEIRQMYGDMDLDNDGNTVYIPATMIPAATNNDPTQSDDDVYVDDSDDTTADDNS